MWKANQCVLRPSAQARRLDGGAMAHRRGLLRRSTTMLVPLVFGGALLLGGVISVSNQVVALRLQVAELQDRREFLEARQASLRSVWNQITAAEVIRRRAEQELGLVVPLEPDPVLVQVLPEDDGHPGLWDRFFAELGGGTPAFAADGSRSRPSLVRLQRPSTASTGRAER